MRVILDMSQPLDVGLFDRIIAAMYDGAGGQLQSQAAQVVAEFQAHPEAWTQADRILGSAQRVESKFIALQTLDSTISVRWNLLTPEQRQGVRNFVCNMCMAHSKTPEELQANRMLLEKLNFTLVQVLKKEWPHNWPNFIQDIVASSKGSDSWMQNNLAILRQLSDEIFEFSAGRMTSQQIRERKQALNSEFMSVFQMMIFVLETKENPGLVCECLACLECFLSWIPLGYIFETNLIQLLGDKFLPAEVTRNAACRCLTEIGSLPQMEEQAQYENQFIALYLGFVQRLQAIVPAPSPADYATAVPKFAERGGEQAERFVANAAQFFTGFFRQHLHRLETHVFDARSAHAQSLSAALQVANSFLIGVTHVDDKEVFKVAVEHWQWLAEDVHKSAMQAQAQAGAAVGGYAFGAASFKHPRQNLYKAIFTEVRKGLIGRMARPEEVIVFEDENGEIVKEQMKDVDALALYDMMRQALVFLTHLDCEDTEHIMLDRLTAQVDQREWSATTLSTLCWAIGSISGAMSEDDERRFIVTVIKDLLQLCESMRGKPNKASIASDIMYVVGQYPRFLCAHWLFLRTVIVKLFEFMHESFEGVQDMACETFLKITHACKEQFVIQHTGESKMFVEELLQDLTHHVQDLRMNQTHMFFEAAGLMVGAAPRHMQDHLVSVFLAAPNAGWQSYMARAKQEESILRDVETMKNIGNILKTYVRAAASVGAGIQQQMYHVFPDMMQLYSLYSGLISQEVATKGEVVTRHMHVRGMRIVKKEILRLIEEFVKHTDNIPMMTQTVLPPLLDAVLKDYNNSVAPARDAQVLSLMTVITQRLEGSFAPHVPTLLAATLQVTLEMITSNFADHPEHRRHFFRMLQALNHHCFTAFLGALQSSRTIVNSIIWAFRHTEQGVQDTGLETLLELLDNVKKQGPLAFDFFAVYLVQLYSEVFAVLTDLLHQTGFMHHCTILQHLTQAAITVSEAGRSLEGQPQGQTAADYVKQRLAETLSGIATLAAPQVRLFIDGLFEKAGREQALREHVRDFLVESKSYAGTVDPSADPLLVAAMRQEEEARKALEVQRQALVPGLAPQLTAQQLTAAPSTADIGMES